MRLSVKFIREELLQLILSLAVLLGKPVFLGALLLQLALQSLDVRRYSLRLRRLVIDARFEHLLLLGEVFHCLRLSELVRLRLLLVNSSNGRVHLGDALGDDRNLRSDLFVQEPLFF